MGVRDPWPDPPRVVRAGGRPIALEAPVSAYDEGFHFTDATLSRAGRSRTRDFYSNYPPGAFATIAALWTLTGPSVAAGGGCSAG